MKLLFATLVLAAAPVAAQAQQPPREFKPSANPVSDAVRSALTREAKNIIAAAELLPADKYGFHPTPEQMSFGKLIAHIAQTNELLCSAIGATDLKEMPKFAETDGKDALVAAVKASFEHCTAALDKTTDAQLGEEVSLLGKKLGMSRAHAMVTIAADWADHYSTAASYLRQNGLLPPTAQAKKDAPPTK
jgi:uncharacterized damage-inducible protein DinB